MFARSLGALALGSIGALGVGATLGVGLAMGTQAHAAPVPARVNIHAVLTGAAVVPGPGAPSGSGAFSAVLVQKGRQLCYDLTLTGAPLANGAAIHVGRPVVADKAVLPLGAPDAAGALSGCVTVPDGDLARHLAFFPDDYYVEVTSADLPRGALRGQLWKDGMEPEGQPPLAVSPKVAEAQAAAAGSR